MKKIIYILAALILGASLEAFSYYEKHPDEYRERLFWMSHTISRAYDMLGDYKKRQEYMDLAGKYDDDPIE